MTFDTRSGDVRLFFIVSAAGVVQEVRAAWAVSVRVVGS
ncbi:hypothetical protein GMYAFLOJ_CDS0081 [Microbacterium phage phiMiGM15]